MAPKRSAQPPPPPVESSEETGSDYDSDESEEEIALSPPAAASNKNMAPPPQKVQQPEASDETEEEEDDEDEEEEEEEEPKSNYTAPPSATRNPPPPPPNREESESDEEEEEETDDEAPQSESAPKQEAEQNGGKLPSSSEDKKRAAFFQRSWSKDDEVRILEILAAHRREHGTLPQAEDLEAALAGSLDNTDYGRKELMGKVKSLKSLYSKAVNRGELPSKDHEHRIFNLSKEVWGGGHRPNNTVKRDFDEMCELYPYLAEEAKAVERTHPGLFKREFSMVDDEKASKMDKKIKNQRLMQMKVELRRHDLTREVTKALMDLIQ